MGAIRKQNAYTIINHLNSVLIAENNMDNTSNIAKRIISKLSKFMREFKTKEDVDRTVIKCTSIQQGKLIVKFYEELGIANKFHLSGSTVGGYYGAIDGALRIFDRRVPSGYKRIRPRLMPKCIPKPKFPRVMLVSNNKKDWSKVIVIAKINKFEYKFIAAASAANTDTPSSSYHGWLYAKEINK